VTTDQQVIHQNTHDYRDPAVRLSGLLDANSTVAIHENRHSGVQAVKGDIGWVSVLAHTTEGPAVVERAIDFEIVAEAIVARTRPL
jgi:hypothetical protein